MSGPVCLTCPRWPPWIWGPWWEKVQPLKSFSLVQVQGPALCGRMPWCKLPLAGAPPLKQQERKVAVSTEVTLFKKYLPRGRTLRRCSHCAVADVGAAGARGGGGTLHAGQGRWLEPVAAPQPCGVLPAKMPRGPDPVCGYHTRSLRHVCSLLTHHVCLTSHTHRCAHC